MSNFTGIKIARKHGLETYRVLIRGVLAHEFMSQQAAEHKLAWYQQQLAGKAA